MRCARPRRARSSRSSWWPKAQSRPADAMIVHGRIVAGSGARAWAESPNAWRARSTSAPARRRASLVLGHLQRGGSPTGYDRLLATRFGGAAVGRSKTGEVGTDGRAPVAAHRDYPDRAKRCGRPSGSSPRMTWCSRRARRGSHSATDRGALARRRGLGVPSVEERGVLPPADRLTCGRPRWPSSIGAVSKCVPS